MGKFYGKPFFSLSFGNLWDFFSFPIEFVSVFPFRPIYGKKSMGPMNCGPKTAFKSFLWTNIRYILSTTTRRRSSAAGRPVTYDSWGP